MSLTLENVSKRVGGETHIDGISLDCAPGSFNVLLGVTLAGKTTLMRIMAGLDRPSEGRVLVNGRDVTGVSVQKRDVAMVYQQFINYPSMSVYDNIASPLKMARFAKSEIDRRVRAEAERMHIDHLLDRLPDELSGGQQQRVAMARALAREAELVLLDEPLVNLDYKLREEFRAEMTEIFAERDSTVVYATTEPVEALTLGGHTAVLHEGRLIQHGSTAEVYHRPASVVISQVFGDPPMNLAEAQIEGGRLHFGRQTSVALPEHLAHLAAGSYRIGVRPVHVFLDRQSGDDVELDGEVEVGEVSGSETYIHLRHDDLMWVVQEEGVHRFDVEQHIRVYVDPRFIFAFDMDGGLVAAPSRVRVPGAA
ncbi:MAG TPA: ABC transporter ATP-binding protein [Gammaproteobacteria bacterium]|nr:ABC transporter ATP-binding protein [Gammaproteobacteria bacterium]